MGADDPRKGSHQQAIDFRLTRLQAAWKKKDPPPHRVKPLPVQVIRRMANVAMHSHFERTKAVADMTILAFFFLLRPGEYVDTNSESTPFKIEDVNFYIGDTWINPATASEQQLLAATRVTLTFATQKNGVRVEIIGLCTSGDAVVCPVRAAVRRLIYLRRNGATAGTPLGHIYPEVGETKADRLQPKHITAAIRDAVKFYGTDLGFLPDDVSARSLRAAGANALLLANVDTNIIRLIGRWRSDEMLRYLHVQAAPLMQDYARRMVAGGQHTLLPNAQLVPQELLRPTISCQCTDRPPIFSHWVSWLTVSNLTRFSDEPTTYKPRPSRDKPAGKPACSQSSARAKRAKPAVTTACILTSTYRPTRAKPAVKTACIITLSRNVT